MNELLCSIMKAATLCVVMLDLPAGGHQAFNFPQGMEKVCIRNVRVGRVQTPEGVTAQEHLNDCTGRVGFYNQLDEPVSGVVTVRIPHR